jgi:hypothetical protein
MRRAPHQRDGRIRGLAIYALALLAVGALLYTPFAWWMNRQFNLRGVKTGTGRIVEKRSVKRIVGEDEKIDHFLDIEYEDGQGVTHRHARKVAESEWKRHHVGGLPGLEYLRDDPAAYRMPGEYTQWYLAPPLALGAVALAGLLLLWIKIDPQDGHGGGSG